MILSNSMSFGKPYILNIDGFIHDGRFVIREFSNTFNIDYLRHLLDSPLIQKRYSQIAAGGVVLNISSDLVNSVYANIPPIFEQEKISKFLNKIDDRIETQNKIIESYTSLIKRLSNLFFKENSDVKLGSIISFEAKTKHKSSDGLSKGKYPFFTNEENSSKYFDSYDYDGSYVICNTGGKAGFNFYDGKFASMSDCFVIKHKAKKTKALYYYLKLKQDYINNKCFKGSGLKHLDKKDFLDIPSFEISPPALVLLDKVENKIILEKQILFNLQTLKKHLLQNLFI